MDDTNRIKRMNFNELREELSYCYNNPVKELLIRKLMKSKYIGLKKKRALNKQKTDRIKQNYYNDYNKMKVEVENYYRDKMTSDTTINDLADELCKELESSKLEPEPKQQNFNNPMFDNDFFYKDDKFKEEIQRDQMNNNLMNRLNSDIYIQRMKDKKKVFDVPFDNSNNGNYLAKIPGAVPPDDFTSNRFISDRP